MAKKGDVFVGVWADEGLAATWGTYVRWANTLEKTPEGPFEDWDDETVRSCCQFFHNEKGAASVLAPNMRMLATGERVDFARYPIAGILAGTNHRRASSMAIAKSKKLLAEDNETLIVDETIRRLHEKVWDKSGRPGKQQSLVHAGDLVKEDDRVAEQMAADQKAADDLEQRYRADQQAQERHAQLTNQNTQLLRTIAAMQGQMLNMQSQIGAVSASTSNIKAAVTGAGVQVTATPPQAAGMVTPATGAARLFSALGTSDDQDDSQPPAQRRRQNAAVCRILDNEGDNNAGVDADDEDMSLNDDGL